MLKPEDVADYLKQNPAFFDQHLDLLSGKSNGEEPTPFHERQLAVLQQRHDAQVARYEEVVESARNNQALESSLHNLTLSLLASSTRDSESASRILVERFDLEAATIIGSEGEDGNIQSDSSELLRQRVAHGSSICDDRVSNALLVELFGPGADVGSCAFVPLSDGERGAGVLVLGASSPERFQPGMGPVYLDRIGQLIGAFLAGGS